MANFLQESDEICGDENQALFADNFVAYRNLEKLFKNKPHRIIDKNIFFLQDLGNFRSLSTVLENSKTTPYFSKYRMCRGKSLDKSKLSARRIQELQRKQNQNELKCRRIFY